MVGRGHYLISTPIFTQDEREMKKSQSMYPRMQRAMKRSLGHENPHRAYVPPVADNAQIIGPAKTGENMEFISH